MAQEALQEAPGSAAAAALDDLLSVDEDGGDAGAEGGAGVIDDPLLASAGDGDLAEDEAAGPSELDALSRAADDQFPDLEARADRAPVSVTVRALNKVTAKFTDLQIPMNTLSAFGPLDIGVFHCDKRPPEDFPEVSAFLQVFDRSNAVQPREENDADIEASGDASGDASGEASGEVSDADGAPDYAVDRTADAPNAFEQAAIERAAAEALEEAGQARPDSFGEPDYALDEPAVYDRDPEGEKVFSGWMFASSPALNPLEHPVYDVWVIDCETRSATSVAEAPSNTESAR